MQFKDRKEAGIRLAKVLEKYKGKDVIVFALPRGGVVLGAEIAKALGAPLDLIITKKIGHPMNPEYAIGAIAEEGEPYCNALEVSRVGENWFQKEVDRIRMEIRRRRTEYLGKIQKRDMVGKIAIIVDDGIATGYTMMAAIKEMQSRSPQRIVVAIPVTPSDTAQTLLTMVDELISLEIDQNFTGTVGSYYLNFDQVKDSEVIALLQSED